MNCLKVFRIIFAVLGFAGMMMLFGVVGASDYADEIGECFKYSDYVWEIIAGILLMIPCPVYENILLKYNLEQEGGDYNDRTCHVRRKRSFH